MSRRLPGLCIIVPVLNRPQNVQPLIDSVGQGTPAGSYRLLFVATEGDTNEIVALEQAGAEYITIDKPGTYARKINLGIRESDEEYVFTGADDIRFWPMWYEHAVALMGMNNGKATVQVVGTNDMGNNRTIHGEHSTHTLVARSYCEDPGGVIDGEPGQFFCELYPHEYTDDEAIETSKSRYCYAHSYLSRVEHLHYLWGKGVDDGVYRAGRSKSMYARRLFMSRRHLWRS